MKNLNETNGMSLKIKIVNLEAVISKTFPKYSPVEV